jgi:hypothetical protein
VLFIKSFEAVAIIGATPGFTNDVNGVNMFLRPDTGLLGLKSDTIYLGVSLINPTTETMTYHTITNGFQQGYGVVWGWDYDRNKYLYAASGDGSTMSIDNMGDGTEALVNRLDLIPDGQICSGGAFKVNNVIYMLMLDGSVARYSTTGVSGTDLGSFVSPWGALTSAMCYNGNGKIYFTQSDPTSNIIAMWTVSGTSMPVASKFYAYPSGSIPLPNGSWPRVGVAADAYSNLYLGMSGDGSTFNIYQCDMTPIPSSVIIQEYPSTLPDNGTSHGVIKVQVLDDSIDPMPNVTVRCRPSGTYPGTYMTGSSLLDPNTFAPLAVASGTTDVSGTFSFIYRAPTITGTQQFIVEAIY